MGKKATKAVKRQAKQTGADDACTGSTRTEDHEFYKNPLYYDIVFDGDITDEVEFYTRMFKEYAAIPVKRVLEPACGNGLYLVSMAKAGYVMVGYDLAPEMVEYSRDRARKAGLDKAITVVKGDMRNITFEEKFDAAINQINSLAYLQADDDIISHFKTIADSLVDGGIYIVELTIKCEDFEKEHKQDESWTMERDGVTCTATWRPVKYDLEKKLRYIDFTMHVEDHGKCHDIHETHELRLWTHEDIINLVRASGLDLVAAIDGNYNKIPDGKRITGDEYAFPYFILQKPVTMKPVPAKKGGNARELAPRDPSTMPAKVTTGKKARNPANEHQFYEMPKYYDLALDRDVAPEIEFYKRMFTEFSGVQPVKRILEPACGTGLFLEWLPKFGFHVSGYDLAKPMVDYTMEKLHHLGYTSAQADVQVGDMRDKVYKEKFDAAINLVNSVGYLTRDEDIVSHFKATAASLNDGALYILEVGLKCEDFKNEWTPDETWTTCKDGVEVTCTWQPHDYDESNKIRHIKFRMLVDDHGKKIQVEETHDLRLWTHEDLVSLAKKGGFELMGVYLQDFTRWPETKRVVGDPGGLYYVFKKKP
ncbi:MAG: class I SAM-dependent methyltransferase [Candidatus Lokiarchaeota archaeon]|nr:class I SAM-dependent methyltransferase [Candidatus Lokiarchaeota archaeon]